MLSAERYPPTHTEYIYTPYYHEHECEDSEVQFAVDLHIFILSYSHILTAHVSAFYS